MVIIIAFLYNELTYWHILLWPNFGNISIGGQNASLIGLYYNYCSSIDHYRSDSKKQRKNNQFTVVLLCRTAQLSKWPWIYRPTNVRADEWIYGWKKTDKWSKHKTVSIISKTVSKSQINPKYRRNLIFGLPFYVRSHTPKILAMWTNDLDEYFLERC